MVAVRADM